MLEVSGEMRIFLTLFLTGSALGLIFDVYRVIKNLFHLKPLMTAFTDILYWLIAIALTFKALIFANWGEMRFYVLIALGFGAILYFTLLSKKVISLLLKTVHILALIKNKIVCFLKIVLNAILKVFNIITMPFRFLFKIFTYPILFIRKKLRPIYYLRQKLRPFKRHFKRKPPPDPPLEI